MHEIVRFTGGSDSQILIPYPGNPIRQVSIHREAWDKSPACAGKSHCHNSDARKGTMTNPAAQMREAQSSQNRCDCIKNTNKWCNSSCSPWGDADIIHSRCSRWTIGLIRRHSIRSQELQDSNVGPQKGLHQCHFHMLFEELDIFVSIMTSMLVK